jgi:Mrp family chromosome partitioning ATPase
MSRNYELLQRIELDRKQADLDEATLDRGADSGAPINAKRNSTIPCDARSRILPAELDPEIFGLVQRLFLRPRDRTMRCVVFFAPGSGLEGGASVCVRTAEALSAHSRGSVCVVDANFSAPTMHHLYSIDNNVGLSEALVQAAPLESYAHKVQDSNLTVIPAGSNPLGWKSAVASEVARQRLTDLCSRFDFVLIEASVNSSLNSAVMLGQFADGAVIVLEADVTRREVARNLVDELRSADVELLGAVLNNRRFPIPEKLYQIL